MQCKQCFCELPDDSNFCPNCRADQRVTYQNTDNPTAPTVSGGDASKDGFAISSLVSSIAAIFSCGLPLIGIMAIVFGILGLKSQKRSIAIAGIIIGGISLLLFFVLIIFVAITGILNYQPTNDITNQFPFQIPNQNY